MHAPGPTEPKRLSGTLGLRDFQRTTPAWPFHTSPKIGTSGLGLAINRRIGDKETGVRFQRLWRIIAESCIGRPTLEALWTIARRLTLDVPDSEDPTMTATRATGVLAAPLRTLWSVGVAGGLSDGQLIDRIALADSEAVELAFELLLERHGAMVLRVCQRVLQDPNDAEDAFQATFLVLLRHADRIRDEAQLPVGCMEWPRGLRPGPRSTRRAAAGSSDGEFGPASSGKAPRNGGISNRWSSRSWPGCPRNIGPRLCSAISRATPTKVPPINLAGRSARCGAGCRGRTICCGRV